MAQEIVMGDNAHEKLADIVRERQLRKLLLVAGGSFDRLYFRDQVLSSGAQIVRFRGFSPNPKYEEICAGLELFRAEGCDAILAVGGGSAIDTAKCIKLFSALDPDKVYIEQEFKHSDVPLIAIPTTAGTGSESTRNAVLYYQGKKYSVGHDCTLPDHALLCPGVLRDLPPYQKKSSMLDALCQGIESWWSLRATDESVEYARAAVVKVMDNYRAYLAGDSAAAAEIMLGANLAGRAINLTATTAAHAMSYKITSLFRIPHGHAVAMALPEIWDYMLRHIEQCRHPGGAEHLLGVFADIASAMGCGDAPAAVRRFRDIMEELEMPVLRGVTGEQLDLLASSVNLQRLENNPVPLDLPVLRSLYERMTGYDS